MRLIETIPHDLYKISIFQFNSKYIVKIELDQYEQSFKINETDVNGLSDVKKMICKLLLDNSLRRFLTMREDWGQAFKTITN